MPTTHQLQELVADWRRRANHIDGAGTTSDAVAAAERGCASDLERLLIGDQLDDIDVAPARSTDPATSKAAARGITVDNARGKIALAFFRDRVFYDGPGLTATAAVRVAKLEHLAAPWKRVSELKEAKIIAPTGRRLPGNGGQKQEELRLTDFGIAEVRLVFPYYDTVPAAGFGS